MKKTTTENITNEQIRCLRAEAFAHGDLVQGFICNVALGTEYTAIELEVDTCLDEIERREVAGYTVDAALEQVVGVINNAEAQS